MGDGGLHPYLAAILNGDVAGYTRLMADDADATAHTMSAYRVEIERTLRERYGRLVDFTGDNFLAELPSAIDAVASAIEIQQALHKANAELPPGRRVEFRLGIHLGDVRSVGQRLYGDGVNVAAHLQRIAQPGQICISAPVHELVYGKLDVPCEDLGPLPVKNVPAPVHVWQIRPNADAGRMRTHPAVRRRWMRRVLLGAAACLALLLGAGWATWPLAPALLLGSVGLGVPPRHPPVPEVPSIVVLPFAGIGPNLEQDYLADGLTEDLTNKLSSMRELFVISRNSAFTYKGKSVRVEDIGRQLGVRYVLEGSLQRSAERVRVTAQLIDAQTGFHTWSQRFDRQMSDIFELQSELAEQILDALEVEIRHAEVARIRRKPTEDLSAYDAFIRAESLFLRFNPTDGLKARELLLRAIELDPGYAQAHGLLAGTYQAAYNLLWDSNPELLDLAWKHARQAVRLDPLLAQGHRVLAHLYAMNDSWDGALRESTLAIELNPNDELAYITHFRVLAHQGEIASAVESTRRALRLNPRNPSISWASLAFIHAAIGSTDKAVELLEKVREANPEVIPAMAYLALVYESSGRHDEAVEVVEEIRAINPALTAEQTRHWLTPLTRGAKILPALRRAGLP